MRYKVIYFYLPMNYAMIGSRIRHFEVESESSIISEHPGSVYSDDFRYYNRVGDTDIYRSSTTDYPSNFFVKIVEEADPAFNADYAWQLGSDIDDKLFGKIIEPEIYNSLIISCIVDDSVLSSPR